MDETTNGAPPAAEHSDAPPAHQIALFAALAKAQAEFKPIAKNREASIRPRDTARTAFSFRYADYEALISATREALTKHGLSVTQVLNGDGALILTTVLAHAEGGSLRSKLRLPGDMSRDDPKQTGILIAYYRRYAYSALLCLAADDDLDAMPMDEGDDQPPQPQQRSVPRREAPRDDHEEVKVVTPAQAKWVADKLDTLGIGEEERMAMFRRYGASAPANVPAAKFDALKSELLKL